jgi:cyclopropane fatty-acyl-phospholipid synthase-like methyltransferase
MKHFASISLLFFVAARILAAQQPGTQPPDHIKHRFDDPAQLAKSFDDPARDAWQKPDQVIAALGLTSAAKVADIGAGTGYFSMKLARAVPSGRVYAVDIEPAMIGHLKRRADAEGLPNVTPVLASAESPNLPKGVDTILIVNTYHHIGGRQGYFRALRSKLNPGGRIAIVDFRKDAPEGPPAHFRFPPEQIKKEMAEAGYAVDAGYDFLPRQHFIVFR